MDKTLIKFYLYFIVSLIIFILCFPLLFMNFHNNLEYIRTKISVAASTKPITINIYDSKANIIIMMDDGWKTQYTIGYNYMKKYNMKGSVAVIPSRVNTINYINKSDLITMENNGWDLLNHTFNHFNLTKIDSTKKLEEIKKGMEWLNNNNFNSNSNTLIYPEGAYDEEVLTIMDKLNIINGRGVEEGFNDNKPKDLTKIKVKNVFSSVKEEEVTSWIDKTINENLTLILLFHKLENVTDTSKMQYDKGKFYNIIDYIHLKENNLNIVTYSDWIRSITINN